MKNKRIFLILSLILFCSSFLNAFEIKENEICEALENTSPFYLSWKLDAPLVTLSASSCVAGLLMQKFYPLPEYTDLNLSLSDVNALDAFFARSYSSGLDTVGTLLCAANLAVFPAAVFGTEFLRDNFPLKEFFPLLTMYAEGWMFSWGIKNILKVSVHRVRPYMYFDVWDMDALENHDFEFSWPSGHTTSAFYGATFLTYAFSVYYPESSWRIPVMVTSYGVAVATGIMRMASGNHFFTDVLTGAALGSICGFIVPFMHHVLPKKENVEFSFAPGGMNVHFVL